MAKILYQGHGSFRILSSLGHYAYVDPFMGEGYDKEAFLILVTHEHYDHNQIQKVDHNQSTVILRAKDMLKEGKYQTKQVGEFLIEAVPAYNQNHAKEECVGYLIWVDGVCIYASGDTSYIEEMQQLKDRNIDYAFYPTDGIYNMDAKEASYCAGVIQAKHDIPIHTQPDTLYNATIVEAFTSPHRLLLAPGETLELTHE